MLRILDIALSVIALLVLSLILVPVILILRVTGEGEIFFIQKRIGKNGEIFGLLKFATMLKNSPYIGTETITVKNDPRVLTFGKFLRKTKINELPQLLNILLGHMSLIGPRPLTQQTFHLYPKKVQKKVQRVKPGLSGIGSIVFRNEEDILNRGTESKTIYRDLVAPYKGALETWFIENHGLGVYLKCIFLTVIVVFSSNSRLVWRTFPNLPPPPEELRVNLSYSELNIT